MTTIAQLELRCAKLEKFMGLAFLEGPQLSQMTPAEFAQLTIPANELPNGEYNFALYQALTNRILADQAPVIAAQDTKIKNLEARPSGSVGPQGIPGPQGPPGPAGPAGSGSGSTSQSPGALVAQDTSGGGHYAELSSGRVLLKANTQHDPMQHGITDERLVEFLCNGWDSGARVSVNWDHVTSRNLPMHIYGFNGWGSFEINWFPPLDNWQGEFRGDLGRVTQSGDPLYDQYRGQGFIVDLGAQSVMKYGTSGNSGVPISDRRHLMMGSQRKGWPVFFVVTPHRSNNSPENWAVMKLDADGGADPCWLLSEGRLQRVVVKVVNGERVFAPA